MTIIFRSALIFIITFTASCDNQQKLVDATDNKRNNSPENIRNFNASNKPFENIDTRASILITGDLRKDIKSILEVNEIQDRFLSLKELIDMNTKDNINSQKWLEIYNHLPVASRERSFLVNEFMINLDDVEEIHLFYQAIPAGKDRRHVATEMVKKKYSTDLDPSETIKLLISLEYHEEFDSAIIGLLSQPNFRKKLSESQIKIIKDEITSRNYKNHALALKLLNQYDTWK